MVRPDGEVELSYDPLLLAGLCGQGERTHGVSCQNEGLLQCDLHITMEDGFVQVLRPILETLDLQNQEINSNRGVFRDEGVWL